MPDKLISPFRYEDIEWMGQMRLKDPELVARNLAFVALLLDRGAPTKLISTDYARKLPSMYAVDGFNVEFLPDWAAYVLGSEGFSEGFEVVKIPLQKPTLETDIDWTKRRAELSVELTERMEDADREERLATTREEKQAARTSLQTTQAELTRRWEAFEKEFKAYQKRRGR